MATRIDTVVIGNGLFGSAAARYLCELGELVAIVGPDEPADHSSHEGVFASHYDQGRLIRLTDPNPSWVTITRWSMAGFRALEEASGIRFFHSVGALIVVPTEAVENDSAISPLTIMRDCEIEHTIYPPGDRSWQLQFPGLDFPDDHYVIHEPAPAGHFNPRLAVEAQNHVALANGAEIIRETVTAVESIGGRVTITTASGRTLAAKKALIAAGAFTNFNGLLTDPLPLLLETEVFALAKVSADDARRLSAAPTVKFFNDDPVLDALYVVPPIRYPDGNFYIKMGANTTADQRLTTLPEVQSWYRDGASDFSSSSFESAFRAMWPGIEIRSVTTHRCVLCRTPSGSPIISEIDDSVFVAVGGNGAGAKGSDGWGQLAAGLVHDGRWPSDVAPLGV